MGRTRVRANASLGASLVKKKKPQWNRETNSEHPEISENSATALKSVTEENSYDEFIATATLANKEFTAEKLNVKFVALSTSTTPAPAQTSSSTDDTGVTLTAGGCGDEEDHFTEEEKRLVVVPRRPKWTKEMTAEELDVAEREAFLEWRRTMAHLQNRQGITPFERNIEVWRQLWRVVERSEVVVQIVDARNPLLYRCEDLEAYVKEMGKRNILLVNKADFLSRNQRLIWSQYFKSINLSYAFYSAAQETEKALKKEAAILEENEDDDNESESSASGSEPEENNENQNQKQSKDGKEEEAEEIKIFIKEFEEANAVRILDREQLIEFLRTFKKDETDLFAVGLVGYPNVGKSSTINSLVAMKKTSVSATPGKTKHFQTLYLEEDILLCDCPGLVMPAFGGSKGEMLLGGILPIDQLTSYHAATDLLIKRLPTSILQARYGVKLPPNYTHEDFLNAYASLRGFMTVRGIPDCSRASRIVLKDYVNGKLCFCHPPPGIESQVFQPTGFLPPEQQPDDIFPLSNTVQKENRPLSLKTRMEKNLDRHFFTPAASAAHYKGTHLVSSGLSSASSSSSSASLDGKPWKKHGNKNRKEKLRRIYRHLDVE